MAWIKKIIKPKRKGWVPARQWKAQRKVEYKEYITFSPVWAAKRESALARAGYRCEVCGKPGKQIDHKRGVKLEVHHKTYAHFKDERPDELQVLCIFHHDEADRDRARLAKAARRRKVVR